MRRCAVLLSLSLGLILGGVLISTIGGALPHPYSAIGPGKSAKLRMELVREAVSKQGPICRMVAGNSRVAFQVNATALSTPECGASNLGFPGLGPAQLLDLMKEQIEARSIIFFVSDDFLIERTMSRSFEPDTGMEWADFGLLRNAVISQYRMNVLIDSIQGKPVPADLWQWNDELGRWNWSALNQTAFAARQDAAAVSQAIAKDYYGSKSIAATEEVLQFFEALKEIAPRLTIVFPPQHSWFVRDIDRVNPGAQRKALEALTQASAKAGVEFIDCSQAGSCGVSDELFADLVHLSAEGAGRFTAFLKSAIAKTENR